MNHRTSEISLFRAGCDRRAAAESNWVGSNVIYHSIMRQTDSGVKCYRGDHIDCERSRNMLRDDRHENKPAAIGVAENYIIRARNVCFFRQLQLSRAMNAGRLVLRREGGAVFSVRRGQKRVDGAQRKYVAVYKQ